MRNPYVTTGWGWALAALLAAVLLTSSSARASCIAASDPLELVWSYPGEGDRDVPLDAGLQLLLSAPLYGSDWSATLNGEPIVRGADGTFAFGALEASTAYTFRLEGQQPRGTTANVVELHFETGSDRAAAVAAPEVVGLSSADSGVAALCRRVDALHTCRDVAPFDVREVTLEEASAVAWIDDAGNVWPRECYPQIDLNTVAQGSCYAMHAVAADGHVSAPSAFCPDTVAGADNVKQIVQDQRAQKMDAASGSCATAMVGRGANAGLVGLLVLAPWLRRRQRRARART